MMSGVWMTSRYSVFTACTGVRMRIRKRVLRSKDCS